MIELSLQEIASATDGIVDGEPGLMVDALATDSRTMPSGSALFVALPGERADGHDFSADAVAAGAVAVLASHRPAGVAVPMVRVEDPWRALKDLAGHVRAGLPVTSVAVTGSVGKTTVKDLIAAAVGAGRRVHASRGSFNNELGVPLTVLGLEKDTEVLVAEIGARHEGDIAALAPMLAPDIAVVTAVEAVHLEVFGSIDAIARAKGELVDALGPDGLAVLNVADPRVAAMAARAARVITVSVDDASADVHALDVHLDTAARAHATAVTPWGRAELQLPVAGRHQVTNALLALAVAGHLGVDVAAAAAAIACAEVSRWRGEVRSAGGVQVLDDAYNANPASMLAALDTLLALERSGRAVAVLGVMAEIGATAHEEHVRVGRACAQRGVDALIVVGAGAVGLAEGAREAGLAEVTEVADVEGAVRAVDGLVRAGDAVLVKGSRVAGLEAVGASLSGGGHRP